MPRLRFTLPLTCEAERLYTLGVVLERWLGVTYTVVREARGDVLIEDADHAGPSLRIADTFFQAVHENWLNHRTLPKSPLRLDATHQVPVLFGESTSKPVVDGAAHHLTLDLFGSIFFLISRYEEAVLTARDPHDRFPMDQSVLWEEANYERPLADEYAAILADALKRLWPDLKIRATPYRLALSHDVDWPLSMHRSGLTHGIKTIGGDLIRRKSIALAARRTAAWAGDLIPAMRRFDPCNTFDFIMDCSDRHGIKSAFYFIPLRKAPAVIDGTYDLTNPWIRNLLRKIHAHGHEIGIHPSYHTYTDHAQLRAEFDHLRSVCGAEGIEQSQWGGRQHFLRWKNPDTWRLWSDVGLTYDSTVGYAERCGFRAGTSREFPAYDLGRRCALSLIERPLIAMDVSLSVYEKLDWNQSVEKLVRLKNRCRQFGGTFSILWHNSSLLTPRSRAAYDGLLTTLLAD